MNQCDKTDDIAEIKKEISGMRTDIKSLLQFKWQIMGGAGLLGIITAFTFSLLGLMK